MQTTLCALAFQAHREILSSFDFLLTGRFLLLVAPPIQNTEDAIHLKDAKNLDYDQSAIAIAQLYRLSCKKYRTYPISMIIKGIAEETCDLSSLSLLSTNLKPLAAIMSSLSHLRSLNFSNNNFKEAGGLILAKGLTFNLRRLVTLNLSNNALGSVAGVEVCRAFKTMHALQNINLSKNCLEDTVLKTLSSNFATKSKKVSVDLSYNNFSDDGVAAFAEIITTCLVNLNMEWNQVSHVGMEAIGKCIADQHPNRCLLESLNLSYNSIGDTGAAICCNIAMSCRGLHSLKLSNNGISAMGGWYICNSFDFCALSTIDLSGNNLSLDVVCSFLSELNLRKGGALALTDLDLSGVSLTPSLSNCPVRDLDSSNLCLDLSSPVDHCVAEIVRRRCHRDAVKVITLNVNGHPATMKRHFPTQGTLKLHMEDNDKSARRSTRTAGSHQNIYVELDMSAPVEKKVAIAQLIDHAIRVADGAATADAPKIFVKKLKFNGKMGGVTASREWFDTTTTGIISYELNDNYLGLSANITCELDVLRPRMEMERTLARVKREGGAAEHIYKCMFDGDLKQWERYFMRECAETNEGDGEVGGAGKGDVERKRVFIHPQLVLPKEGEMSVEIQPTRPIGICSEYVELNLAVPEDRNLAYIYCFRSRYCVGEGLLDPLIDGEVNEGIKNLYKGQHELPTEGIFTFIYIITRPMQGLLKAGCKVEGLRLRDRHEHHFCLDLGEDGDRTLAQFLRGRCMGSNTSSKCVMMHVKLGDDCIRHGKVVDDSWEFPREGTLTFDFVPCVGIGVMDVAEKWLDGVSALLKAINDDFVRGSFLQNLMNRGGNVNISSAQLGRIMECMDTMDGKAHAFVTFQDFVTDILDGFEHLGANVGSLAGTTNGLMLMAGKGLLCVQMDKTKMCSPRKKFDGGGDSNASEKEDEVAEATEVTPNKKNK